MSALTVLRVTDLHKRYGGIIALDGVDLEVTGGELLGIIGPNGSGKSTLFDCVTGLVAPDAGRVSLREQDVTGRPLHALATRGLVRTFQKTAVFGSLSLLDNLIAAGQARADGGATLSAFALGATARRRTNALTERALSLLEALDLAPLTRTPAAAVSFGQQKLVQFASCLMSEPALVLLDEPLAGVNPVLIERMVGHIRRHNQAGTTFVIIEHNIDVLLGLCGRVIVLARGRVLAAGAPDAVARDARVVEAYLGG